MKYLSDYTNDLQSKLFAETGAFFAFSQKQIEEGTKPDVEYTHVGAGLYAPKDRVVYVLMELEAIQKKGVEQDIEENGIEAIIKRELGNYETQLTNDLSDALGALSDYPVTEKQVRLAYTGYYQECIDNDWF
jgi:hypothetical protein